MYPHEHQRLTRYAISPTRKSSLYSLRPVYPHHNPLEYHLAVALIVSSVAIAGCATPPPPQVFPPETAAQVTQQLESTIHTYDATDKQISTTKREIHEVDAKWPGICLPCASKTPDVVVDWDVLLEQDSDKNRIKELNKNLQKQELALKDAHNKISELCNKLRVKFNQQPTRCASEKPRA